MLPDTAFELEALLIAPPNQKGQRIISSEVRIARSRVKPDETLGLGDLQVGNDRPRRDR